MAVKLRIGMGMKSMVLMKVRFDCQTKRQSYLVSQLYFRWIIRRQALSWTMCVYKCLTFLEF